MEKLRNWCNFINEVIHALMNKNVDKVNEDFESVRFIGSQVSIVKKVTK